MLVLLRLGPSFGRCCHTNTVLIRVEVTWVQGIISWTRLMSTTRRVEKENMSQGSYSWTENYCILSRVYINLLTPWSVMTIDQTMTLTPWSVLTIDHLVSIFRRPSLQLWKVGSFWNNSSIGIPERSLQQVRQTSNCSTNWNKCSMVLK